MIFDLFVPAYLPLDLPALFEVLLVDIIFGVDLGGYLLASVTADVLLQRGYDGF